MRTNKLQKQAQIDAAEYAGAYMAIGEGAGNRRKLIDGTVDYKMEFVPGYREAFTEAHAKQDMAKHAERARKENQRRERSQAAERNTKAVLSGDMKNADLKVIALIGIGVVAHHTGFDKKVFDFTKKKIDDVKRKFKKAKTPDNEGVYNITNAR
jgi:hypothetical protein